MKRQKHRRDDTDYKKITGKYSDDSDEETELFPRKPVYQEPPTVEKIVEEGDTLQSLAIRYGCSVAELKRLNHILNDNEIYAKGVVKVPDRPISSILAGVHSSGRSSPNVKARKDNNLDLLENKFNDSLSLSLNLPSTSKNQSFNEVIFNSTISNRICDTSDDEPEDDGGDEEVTLMPKLTVVEPPIVVSKYTCSGADADISWIALIVFAVIVIVAVPLIYSFYIYEHPEQYHHHIVHNSNNSNHSS